MAEFGFQKGFSFFFFFAERKVRKVNEERAFVKSAKEECTRVYRA